MMKCKHYNGEGYQYYIVGDTILLCNHCNFMLAPAVMRQMAIHVFSNDMNEEWLKEADKDD